MTSKITEGFVLAVLGVCSIAAAVFVSDVVRRRWSDAPVPTAVVREERSSIALREAVARLEKEFGALQTQFTKRIDEITVTVRALEQQMNQPRPVEGALRNDDRFEQAMVDAVARADAYARRREFREAEHAVVLDTLTKLYAVKNLRREQNNLLLRNIQMLNDIATTHAISVARDLPPADSAQFLRTFLRSTPYLTDTQRTQVLKQSPLGKATEGAPGGAATKQ